MSVDLNHGAILDRTQRVGFRLESGLFIGICGTVTVAPLFSPCGRPSPAWAAKGKKWDSCRRRRIFIFITPPIDSHPPIA
jgi:hypothetical protein